MRVLYLTPGIFDKGGISRYNRHQIDALHDLYGVDNVAVVSMLGPSGTKNDLETPFSVDWHGSGLIPEPGDKLGFTRVALRFARKFRPGVIWCGHLHFAGLTHVLAAHSGAIDVVQVYGYEVWTPRWYRPDAHWGLGRANYVISDCHATADTRSSIIAAVIVSK